jgi:hypothetical protein
VNRRSIVIEISVMSTAARIPSLDGFEAAQEVLALPVDLRLDELEGWVR